MTLQVEQVYVGCTRLRLELADWLGTLSASQLNTPSLCSEWTVREVAGHLLVSLQGSPRKFVVEILRRGFSIDRANDSKYVLESEICSRIRHRRS